MEIGATNASDFGLTSSLTGATGGGTMGKDEFLKLLVAQLEHQDPLSPMENTQFVAQLSQFSSLEQLMGVNTNLETQMMAQLAMTNSQVAGLIGKEVEAKGDTVQLSDRGTADVNFELPTDAASVKVDIFDTSGNQIRSFDLSGRPAGLNSAQWDGRDARGNTMPPGTYTVSVTAKDSANNDLAVSSRFKGMVTGVTYQNGTPLLEVGGSTLQVGDVLAVRAANTP